MISLREALLSKENLKAKRKNNIKKPSSISKAYICELNNIGDSGPKFDEECGIYCNYVNVKNGRIGRTNVTSHVSFHNSPKMHKVAFSVEPWSMTESSCSLKNYNILQKGEYNDVWGKMIDLSKERENLQTEVSRVIKKKKPVYKGDLFEVQQNTVKPKTSYVIKYNHGQPVDKTDIFNNTYMLLEEVVGDTLNYVSIEPYQRLATDISFLMEFNDYKEFRSFWNCPCEIYEISKSEFKTLSKLYKDTAKFFDETMEEVHYIVK